MKSKYTKELLETIVRESNSWAIVCRKLGIKPATGSQTYIKKRVQIMGIKFSHFIGKQWNKGRAFGPKRILKYFLIKDGPFINSHFLKLRLIKEGVKENKCEWCGLSEWLEEELPLELDHINSDHNDNRLENLKILCPNCHAVKTRRERSIGATGRHNALRMRTT